MFDNILTVDGWVESVAIDLHLQTKTHRTPTWLFRWAIEIAEDLLSRGYIKGYKYPLKEGYFVKMSNSNTLDRIGEP